MEKLQKNQFLIWMSKSQGKQTKNRLSFFSFFKKRSDELTSVPTSNLSDVHTVSTPDSPEKIKQLDHSNPPETPPEHEELEKAEPLKSPKPKTSKSPRVRKLGSKESSLEHLKDIKYDTKGMSKTPRVEGSPKPSFVKTPRSLSMKNGMQLRKSFCAFEEASPRSKSDSIDLTMLYALKDIIGVGETNVDKTRSAMEQLKLMFQNPSETVVVTLVPNITRPNKRFITKESKYYVIMDSLKESIGKTYDCWSSLKLPEESWTDTTIPFNVRILHEGEDLHPELTGTNENIEALKIDSKENIEKAIRTENQKQDVYHIETNYDSCTHTTDLNYYEVVNCDDDFTFFKQFFYDSPKASYVLFPKSGIILVYQKTLRYQFVMMFQSEGMTRFVLPNNESVPKWCQHSLALGEKPVKTKNSEKLREEMRKLENQVVMKTYKIGVLYGRQGQQSEDEMYRNNNDECSPAFWKFMDLLGKRYEQNGFIRYNGGLDVKNKKTGEFLYFGTLDNYPYEILFHVAPLLPNTQSDQMLERKRFVGNDVVVVVFKEMNDKNDTFWPQSVASQFNHVFIVVTPLTSDETNDKYKVNVVCKGTVKPFPPFLEDKWYTHGFEFKNMLLRKILNGERTCLVTEQAFVDRTSRATERLIKYIISSCLEPDA
ncbi:rap GTPase-activating protein, putative [Entamoeba invadens IP1]|uniref:Rap GTPase-activating protein, putative n=1 Tax=Entamoeba invadens IP1 TaxID=370355 RepID=A0A0A1UGY8_ENTIV|nr:rap GTPase-activating protein, putative [Entamoeba invadens IP1]ELP94313.1 rap GTPase-activating protein, putative [Entamoeba invadens IP1]|eukprot:XP_004261084.1 rap GTPase-activating protein, putative [Entamoeba invadens IP1]